MSDFTILDGLNLTIISMIVVFIVLAAIWGMIELTAKVIAYFEPADVQSTPAETQTKSEHAGELITNPKNKRIAEIMALVLASEDQPDKKFEITASKRVK